MANNFKINATAFYDMRRTPEVQKKLEDIAEAIAHEANTKADFQEDPEGYKTSSVQGEKSPQGRWRTTVITATEEAVIDNATNNTLLGSIDAGRI